VSPEAGSRDRQRLARAALTWLAEPRDPHLAGLLGMCEPDEVLAAIRGGRLPAQCRDDSPGRVPGTTQALRRWQLRLRDLPDDDTITAACRDGIRLLCPDDAEWPAGLDDLGQERPYALWLRGSGDLSYGSVGSVSVVGSRAATGYGAYVGGELAAGLAGHGWQIVSGGAYGIDAAAHRGALAAGGRTVALLACGVDRPYPAGHDSLFASIAVGGLVASEWPPGSRPTRLRFLIRNSAIAALTQGTVVVEAGQRSGALNTARHAARLGRPLMAVPGPVTSAQSAGCHQIIRDLGAALVTSTADILNVLSGTPEPDQAGR